MADRAVIIGHCDTPGVSVGHEKQPEPEWRPRPSPRAVVAGGVLHAGVAFMLAPGLVITYAYGSMSLSSYDQLAWLGGAPAATVVVAWLPVLLSVMTAGALTGDLWLVPVLNAVVDRAWLVYIVGAGISIVGALVSLAFYVRPETFGG